MKISAIPILFVVSACSFLGGRITGLHSCNEVLIPVKQTSSTDPLYLEQKITSTYIEGCGLLRQIATPNFTSTMLLCEITKVQNFKSEIVLSGVAGVGESIIDFTVKFDGQGLEKFLRQGMWCDLHWFNKQPPSEVSGPLLTIERGDSLISAIIDHCERNGYPVIGQEDHNKRFPRK